MSMTSSPDERRHFILAALKDRGRLTTAELAAEFDMSEDTARRDFRELATEGLIQRVHGAALPLSPAEHPFKTRSHNSRPVKDRLAIRAASLIKPGQVVIFDGGTSNLAIARQVSHALAFTAITNSPETALALVDHPAAEVILLGGVFEKHSRMTVGTAVLESFGNIHADLLFFGVHGIDASAGLTTSGHDEALLKRAMISAASESVAVVTADKIGTAATYRIGPVTQLNTLIVEREADGPAYEALSASGLAIELA